MAQKNCETRISVKAGMPSTASSKVPRPVMAFETEEDQRSDAGGQQARHQHHAHHGPGQAGDLHEQEGTEDGRAQKGADGGEAARGPDHEHGLRGGVLLHEPHDQHGEAAADGDERGLGADHGAEGQRGEGGEDDAGEERGLRGAVVLEPVGRGVATGAGQLLDGEGHEQAADHQERDRPPGRRRVEAEVDREGGEDPLLALRRRARGSRTPPPPPARRRWRRAGGWRCSCAPATAGWGR